LSALGSSFLDNNRQRVAKPRQNAIAHRPTFQVKLHFSDAEKAGILQNDDQQAKRNDG
jgi:hypothetical protein